MQVISSLIGQHCSFVFGGSQCCVLEVLIGHVVCLWDEGLFDRIAALLYTVNNVVRVDFDNNSATRTISAAGVIVPNAVLAPCHLGGVTVQRASLHNTGHVLNLGLRLGDTVRVERRGDVIPQVSLFLS